MFLGLCVFFDHAICFVIKDNQVDINSTETVKEKITFERESQSNLVVMKGNQNHIILFNASEFMV